MSTGLIRTLLALPEGNWATELRVELSQNGFVVVGMATRALVAWTLFRETCPGLAVVADYLIEDDGLTICRAIRAWQPTTRVVLVTPDNEAMQVAAAQAGVTSCLRPDLPLPAWPNFLT